MKIQFIRFFLVFILATICFIAKGQQNNQYRYIIPNGIARTIEKSSFVVNGGINVSTGDNTGQTNYISTDYIKVDGVSYIEYRLPYSAGCGVAFFDKNRNIIPSYGCCSKEGGALRLTIPSDCSYIRFSTRTDTPDTYSDPILHLGILTDIDAIIGQFSNVATNTGDIRTPNERKVVFSNKEYSVPYGYARCIMPNHQVLNDGTIVAVTELFDDAGRYGLAIKRSLDQGNTWSGDIKFGNTTLNNGLIDKSECAGGGNPVLLYDRINDVLFLFYQPKSYRISKDHGKTWGEKKSLSYLYADQKGMGVYASPCNGIQLQNGVLAILYRVTNVSSKNPYGTDCVGIVYSRDFGDTWLEGPLTPTKDKWGNSLMCDESALAEFEPNRVMINARGSSELIWASQSNRRVLIQTNKGKSSRKRWLVEGWELESSSDLKLIDPVCQGSFIKANLYGKTFGLFLNCNSVKDRKDLLLRVSSDFRHWSPCLYITSPEEKTQGYSSMCCINNELSVMSSYEGGVFFLPFSYEMLDKVMRVYGQNKIAYQYK